jgi:voltage-gated potassium channel
MTKPFRPHKHLVRYSKYLLKSLVTPTVLYVVVSGNVILVLGAMLFYGFEVGINPSVQHPGDAVWWAFTTVTTVGYGDIVPVTAAGRVVAVALMISGIFFFYGFTAILITVFSSYTAEEVKKTELMAQAEYHEVTRRLDEISRQLVVLEGSIKRPD